MSTGQGGAGVPAEQAEEARPSAALVEHDRQAAVPAPALASEPAAVPAAGPVPVPDSATSQAEAGTAGTAGARAEALPESRAARWRRRLRDPETGRPVWWIEILILVALYYCYTGTRSFAEGSVAEATRTGQRLLHWQAVVGLDIELPLNHWLATVQPLALASCYYYATLHFIVTPAVILWMHRRHPRKYSRARWTLAFTTILCLIGFFLFPTAPPRLLPGAGYIDTMAANTEWGWWSASASAAPHGLGKVANLYAAMPSLHCAWALWCGVLIARNARWTWVRVLGALYPLGTAFVVMATANHYILDVFAGWAVLGVSALAATAVTRRSARRLAAGDTSAPPGGGGGPHPSGPAASPAGDAVATAGPAAAGSASAAAGSASAAAASPTPPGQRTTGEPDRAVSQAQDQARPAASGLVTLP